ncbi:imelysin family protein [Longitalea luteola]|uniref:imelysin family protein n=1 Tax=Longitalea luteola TaxID=2812563 RepID=UPI001A96677E|nr:imelysin family protein [Longitalea luteola]
MKRTILRSLAVLALTTGVFCNKSADGEGDGNDKGFDKTGMLTNYADQLIIPAYALLQEKVNNFQALANTFLETRNTANQQGLLEGYKQLHLQYTRVEAYNLGPAVVAGLEVYLNYNGGIDYNFATNGELVGFSIDSTTIENNISSGNYDLTQYVRNSFYAQGFAAINYLFFGPNAIQKFNSNTVSRVKYAKDVVNRIKTLVDKINIDWTAYRTEFVSNTKTNVGSPIGNMINGMAYDLDVLKGPRIGWPFGKQSNGIAFPAKVEAFFAGNAAALAQESMRNLKKIFTANGSGKGFADYLKSLNREDLANQLTAQFDLVITKLEALPDPLSTTITAQPAKVEEAYKEIQKLLTLIKTDLASATGVQITFMDNDGD